jgi:peptidoglycan/xylan/chitin deacetylase (PgdA/CDA1 family)
MMSWKEVEELHRYGMEIGSHTMTHPRLNNLDAAAVKLELTKSFDVLTEVLGQKPVSFAYPYGNGQDNPAVRKAVKDAGYLWATTVHQGKADLAGDPYRLNRIFVRGDDTAFDFHLNMTRGKSRL